jgi:hypothetical protein
LESSCRQYLRQEIAKQMDCFQNRIKMLNFIGPKSKYELASWKNILQAGLLNPLLNVVKQRETKDD